MGKIKGNKGCLLGFSIFLIFCLTGCGPETGEKQTDLLPNEKARIMSEELKEEESDDILQTGNHLKNHTDIEDLKAAVIEILGKNYWPDAMISEKELDEQIGISANMYDSYLAEYQHSEAGIDMMIIIKAKEEKTAEVEKILNKYRESLLDMNEEQPQNKAKVFASRIEIIDNYVCFVQLGADISGLAQAGEEEMVAHCQHENERAIDIIEKTILAK